MSYASKSSLLNLQRVQKTSMTLKTIVRVLIGAALATIARAGDERLCSIPPVTYAGAKATYPDVAFALTELEKRGIATWYSDREANGDYVETAKQLVAQCSEDTRMMVVVYGLPNKDCDAGYSTQGSRVKTASDYEQFVGTLASIVGQRKVLYVLEPDAVGLLAKEDGSCAVQSGYKPNLQTAVRILSGNPNAQIYVDVGYWNLQYPAQTAAVANIIRELSSSGRVKGITLNTSNYRSNSELSQLCGNFQNAIGNYDMRCIIDTSRNFNGPPPQNEWCNLRSAGIGQPPSSNTGISNIDYFVWIKPPGDSDGTCASGRTSEAMAGPDAGVFFHDGFASLWAQGFLVKQEGWPRVGESTPAPTPTPTPSPTPTPAPTPEPTTSTPPPNTTVPEPTAHIEEITSDNSTSGSSSSDVDPTWEAILQEAPDRNTTTQSSTSSTEASRGSFDGPNEVDTEEAPSGVKLDTGAIVFIVFLALAVVAAVVVVTIHFRRKRLAREPKTPRATYYSVTFY